MADAKDKLIVCTLDKNDSGAACPHCGYATGGGHGKAWG